MAESDGRRGAELAHVYYREVVRPLLVTRWPGLRYSAARLGAGSEVLGLDDGMSRDHDWGLRLTLLVDERLVAAIDDHLATALPREFAGFPTRFAVTGDERRRHRVEIQTLESFLDGRVGVHDLNELQLRDWLSFTGQSVLEVTAGPVFRDDGGRLGTVREVLEWYPGDVWAAVVGSCWVRLDEELPLMGRAGQIGDERGSRVIGARLVHNVMRLVFLLERRWAPYAKWFGAAFDRLPAAGAIGPHLDAALASGEWRQRQRHLARALDEVLELQARAGLPAPRPAVTPFWNRPFLAANGEIAQALARSIADPAVRALPRGRGGIEQMTDDVGILVDPRARRRLVAAT